MTTYQEKRLVMQLDEMAKKVVTWTERPAGETIGALMYLIWEVRQTLDLPDVPGLHPI